MIPKVENESNDELEDAPGDQDADDQPAVIHRTYKAATDDIDKASRTVVSIITTDAIDRYYEVVVPKGMALKNYRENPVVLWMHDMRLPPIAKNIWIKAKGNGLIAKTQFATTKLAMEIFDLYAEEFLNGWSIGAQPDYSKCSPPTAEEIKARPDLKKCYYMIRACELVEYSAVGVPANPECLGNEIGKALTRSLREQVIRAGNWPDLAKAQAPAEEPEEEPEAEPGDGAAPLAELPPLIGRTFAQAVADQAELIRNLTGPGGVAQAVDRTMDRLKGRP